MAVRQTYTNLFFISWQPCQNQPYQAEGALLL